MPVKLRIKVNLIAIAGIALIVGGFVLDTMKISPSYAGLGIYLAFIGGCIEFLIVAIIDERILRNNERLVKARIKSENNSEKESSNPTT